MFPAVRFALAGTGLALGILFAGAASAATSPAMQACSDQWSQLKADDKVPAGQTWPKFWSQCAKDYAAAHPDDAAAAADKTAAAPAEPPPAKTKSTAKTAAKTAPAPAPAPADDAAAGGKGKSPAMAACSDQWAKLKADNKVPAGQTWPKFWSQCAKDYAAAHPDEAAAAKSTAKSKAAKANDDELGAPLPDPEVAAKVDPNKPAVAGKKEPTPGQKAAWARMRACGAEWQSEKKAGTLPAGAKWPQYWSDCNKRLKAKGQ
ncbi:MAG: hypothetical protein J0H11_06360 [Rhizobiales bacterium]|nr:hypothetical protein [Hyphomicrobiales bacterium]